MTSCKQSQTLYEILSEKLCIEDFPRGLPFSQSLSRVLRDNVYYSQKKSELIKLIMVLELAKMNWELTE